MGLSIANTMSPFMGRGAPMTVIKGGFALGLALKANDWYSLVFAPSIRLAGLATSSTGFSYKVTGRGGLWDYASPQGLTDISAPTYVNANSDYNGFVRLYSAPSAEYYEGSSADGRLAAEEAAHSACPELGTVVAPDVRIVIYGKLDSLSLGSIATGGVAGSGVIVTGTWSSQYRYSWPNGTHNGWYASEVHVFDNPQLRGHVSAGSAKLFWDC